MRRIFVSQFQINQSKSQFPNLQLTCSQNISRRYSSFDRATLRYSVGQVFEFRCSLEIFVLFPS